MIVASLIAVLLALCGTSLFRQAQGKIDPHWFVIWGIVCWLLSASILLVATVESARAAGAPMPTNPAVTQANINKTICVSGWTATVRPPVSYTNKIKRQKMAALGIPWSRASEIELDHLIPLVAGGNPSAPDNLRLQSWANVSPWPNIDSDAHGKDSVEVALHKKICRGEITLEDAQRCIYEDWRACAKKLGLPIRK